MRVDLDALGAWVSSLGRMQPEELRAELTANLAALAARDGRGESFADAAIRDTLGWLATRSEAARVAATMKWEKARSAQEATRRTA